MPLKDLYEQNMRLFVKERSKGLSEITGRPGGVIHHILGRGIPNGFQAAPGMVRLWWPHVPPGCMVLTAGEHEATIKYPKMLRFLLVRMMLLQYPDRIWEGRSYKEWLQEPPFAEWL